MSNKYFIVGIEVSGLCVPIAAFKNFEDTKPWSQKPDAMLYPTMCFEMEENGEFPVSVMCNGKEMLVAPPIPGLLTSLEEPELEIPPPAGDPSQFN